MHTQNYLHTSNSLRLHRPIASNKYFHRPASFHHICIRQKIDTHTKTRAHLRCRCRRGLGTASGAPSSGYVGRDTELLLLCSPHRVSIKRGQVVLLFSWIHGSVGMLPQGGVDDGRREVPLDSRPAAARRGISGGARGSGTDGTGRGGGGSGMAGTAARGRQRWRHPAVAAASRGCGRGGAWVSWGVVEFVAACPTPSSRSIVANGLDPNRSSPSPSL